MAETVFALTGIAAAIIYVLAVVIGGTLMAGGRFSLLASIVGTIIIQATTTSMYAFGVPAFALQAIKAVVVIFVILLYSEQVRGLIRRLTVQKEA